MIMIKLILLGIFLFISNIIYAQQTNKKKEELIRKGIIVNAEGTSDIIERQNAYDKQYQEMIQLHKEAEMAKQARDIEIKRQEMELLVAKQKAAELQKQKEVEKQITLQKKETIFYLCVVVCLIFFSVLSFIFYKNNYRDILK